MSTGHHPTCFCFECRGDLRPPIVKAQGFFNEREPGRYYPAEKEGKHMGSLLSKYYDEKAATSKKSSRPFLGKEFYPKFKKKVKIKIVELREISGGYSPLGLDFDCPVGNFTIGLKADSVLLSQLVQAFGKNESKWKGKSAALVLVKDKYINLATS